MESCPCVIVARTFRCHRRMKVEELAFLEPVKTNVTGRIGTLRKHDLGVNPSVETIRNWHTCRSMDFPSQTSSPPSGWRPAGEAEASSAGEPLAEDYPAGDSSGR